MSPISTQARACLRNAHLGKNHAGARPTAPVCRVSATPLRPLLAMTVAFVLFGSLTSCMVSASAQSLSDQSLAQIRFEQKLNTQIPLGLKFRDEAGDEVRLSQYFGGKPVVLVFGYYECPMLCTLVLNGFVEAAADMKWSIGEQYEVVNISINPEEKPELAAAKKRTYLKRYGRRPAAQGWHFLTGSEQAIHQLANEAGFHYAYDPASKQYAHPSGLIIITPAGKISKYLFGVTYAPTDLFTALREASASQVGSPIQQLILLCFHYNPITGKYSGLIITLLRVLGAATMLGLLALIVILLKRGRSAQAALAVSPGRGAAPGLLAQAPTATTTDHAP